MFCSKCGAKNPDGNSFCQGCGEHLIVQQPPAQPTSTHEARFPPAQSYQPNKTVIPKPTRMRKTWLIITASTLAVGLLVTLVLILTGNPLQKTKISDDATYNITVADGWVYYNGGTLADNGTLNNASFCKMRADGSEKTRLSNDVISGIIVIDDWIFYLGNDTGTIRKMRTDGSDDILIHKVDGDVELITVADDWIYFISKALFEPGIYKVRTDGTGETKLSDDDFGLYASHIAEEADGWIYYCSDGCIYKIRLNGSDRIKLSDDTAEYLVVVDGWIYFYGGTLDVDGEPIDIGVYKMRTDGSERSKLGYLSEQFNVSGGYIFYANYDGIYRIRLNSSEETKLIDDRHAHIAVEDSWIYYFIPRENGIYRIRTGVHSDGDVTEMNTSKDAIDTAYGNEVTNDLVLVNNADSEDADESRGNTPSNIVNYGMVAQEGDWIYYRNVADDGKLYKMLMDGSEKKKLSDDEALYINAADGWLYYCGTSRDESGNDFGGLYKMRTDGTAREALSEVWTPRYISVVDGWIYYAYDGLYKMRIDGTENTKINETESIIDINVVNGWIYFIDRDSYLHKISTNGNEAELGWEIQANSIHVIDGWIYCIGGKYTPSSNKGEIFKISTDGSDFVSFDEYSGEISVADGWIFYTDVFDSSGSLYKMRTDGTEKSRLSDFSYSLNILNGWIYYYNDGELYRMHIDGSEKQPIG